jgi:protein gp37
MSDKSKIEWTQATWNCVTGCSKVSEGCRNCYALRDWARLSANPNTVYHGRKFTDVQCHPERLDQPLRWTKPRRVFVNSMSDLFHESVPDAFIDQVFAVMALAKQHVFQVLTKRPDRMLDYLSVAESEDSDWLERICDHAVRISGSPCSASFIEDIDWPIHNIWLGVSIEDQPTADERIPLLLQTPAAVRWVSAEPLLGPVDLGRWVYDRDEKIRAAMNSPAAFNREQAEDGIPYPLDWLVVGGESGPNARPMHPDWPRSLRDQCQAAGVPFFFKQWGEWIEIDGPLCRAIITDKLPSDQYIDIDGSLHSFASRNEHKRTAWSTPIMRRVGKKAAGRLLDGRAWDEYPT